MLPSEHNVDRILVLLQREAVAQPALLTMVLMDRRVV